MSRTAQAAVVVQVTPLALREAAAAAFLGGMSTSKFREMVKDGDLPQPIKLGGIACWDTEELREAWAELRAKSAGGSSWDD